MAKQYKLLLGLYLLLLTSMRLSAQDTAPPQAPVIQEVNIGDGYLHVFWSASSSAGEEDFVGYGVAVATDPLMEELIFGEFTSEIDFVIEGLENEQTYYVAVLAYDRFENYSNFSSAVAAMPLPGEVEPNNFAALANAMNIGRIGYLNNNDTDYYAIECSAGFEYTITIVPYIDLGDPLEATDWRLYNSNDTVTVLFQATHNENGIAQGKFTPTESGTYYIRVIDGEVNAVGHYVIDVSERGADEYEDDDSFDAANNLNAAMNGELSVLLEGFTQFPSTDLDVFAYTAEAGTKARFDITANLDMEIILQDEAGNLLKRFDQAGQAEASLYYFTEAGTYYYSLIHSNNEPGGTGEYSIEFSVELPSPLYGALLINELATGANNGAAFIELHNRGTEVISIEGMIMRGTVAADISNANVFNIAPASYLTIGGNNSAFQSKYGYELDLVWDAGAVNNRTDTLEIWQNGQLVEVLITGLDGWPSYTGNLPYTYEKINKATSNKKANDWQISYFPYGTADKRNSFASSYTRDRNEPNNRRETASPLLNENYEGLSLTTQPHASSFDSVDWYLIELAPLDTFNLSLEFDKDTIPLILEMYNTLGELIMEGIANDTGLEIAYIVPSGENNEEFFFAVKALHGEGMYNLRFRTKYSPSKAIWTETFNAARDHLIAPHWEVVNADGNPNRWEVESALNNGDGLAATIEYNPNGNDDWLITPVLEVGQRDEFSILTRMVTIQGTGRSYTETFQIWVGPETASFTSDFTDSLTQVTIDHDSYKRYAWDMAAYAGQRIRIGIRNVSVNQNQQLIDEARLQAFPDLGQLSGRVTNQKTDSPIEGANVQVGDKSTTTNAEGLYTIADVLASTQKVVVTKQGYQTAYNHVVVEKNQINSLPISLLATNFDTAYYTGLENEDLLGRVDSLVNKRWVRSSSFDFNNKTIKPGRNYMLLFGGEQGYPTGNYSAFWRNKQPIDLRNFDDATISFKAYIHTEKDSAGLQLLMASVHEPSSYLILNPQGTGLNQRLLSGNTEGWRWYSFDISHLAHPYFGEGVSPFFEFVSQSQSSAGFGVAIDSIMISGNRRKVIDPASYLTATSYENQQVSLNWEASTTEEVTGYQIFRTPITEDSFELVGQSNGTTYIDRGLENGRSYKYTIVSKAPYGESAFSNIVSAKIGAPSLVKIMYDATSPLQYTQNFEQLEFGELPNDFEEYFRHETHFEWTVGTAETASSAEVNYEPHGKFAYVRQFDLGGERLEILDEAEGTVLATPWFDISELQHNLVLRFETHSDIANQKHYLAYKKGINQPWQVFDSLGNFTEWVAYQHNLNTITEGVDSLQLGFWITHPADSHQEVAQGWGIDDIVLADLPSAFVTGKISAKVAGTPMPAAVVRVVDRDTEVYADRLGNYRIDNADLYAGDVITLEVLAWASNDTLVRANISMEASGIVQDFSLSPILPRPQELQLIYEPTGAARLDWKETKPVGYISHHDGVADGAYSSTEKWLALPFEIPKSMPFFLDSMQLSLIPKGDNASVEIYLLGKGNNGRPDWSKQLYHSNMVAVEASGITTLKPNRVIIEHNFFVVAKVLDAELPLDASFGGQGFESVGVGEAWVQDQYVSSLGFMIDFFIGSGVEFTGGYRVYAGTLPEELNLLGNTQQNSFTDTNIAPGQERHYRVSALYTAGESDQSKLVTYNIDSLPWLTIDTTPIEVIIPYGAETASLQFPLGNEGLDLLRYSIDFQPNEGQHARIAGSRLFTYSQPVIGDTTELTLIIENRGQDQEGIGYALVRMPEGMSVLHSTNFEVAGSDAFLFSNSATGREVQWFNPNGEGRGAILPGEKAYARIRVVTASSFNETPSFEYALVGDGSGEEAHRIDETFIFQGFPITVSSEAGTIEAGNQATVDFAIGIQEGSPETYEGVLHVMSNDINRPEIFVPINFVVQPSEGIINGQVVDGENNQPLEGITISLGKRRTKTNDQGYYSFDEVLAGEYTLYAYHPDYSEVSDEVLLANGRTSVVLNFALSASLPAPFNLTAADLQDRVKLTWEIGLEEANVFSMEGIPGEPVRYPWTGHNYDGLLEEWKYSGRESSEGESSLTLRTADGQRNSWLFSPAMELRENASFQFKYKADTHNGLVDEEHIVVRLSTQAVMDTSSYSVILWDKKATNKTWEEISIPLTAYAGQSIRVAIQVRSRNQEAIYLDEFSFGNAVQLEASRILRHFEMHRIVNGQDAVVEAEVSSSENSYEDSEVDAENSYAYHLNAVYNTGTSEQSNNASIILKNLPPILAEIADQRMDEDSSLEILLNATDGNKDSIRYALVSDTSAVNGSIVDNLLILSSLSNWHGEANLLVIGTDGLAKDTASFKLEVSSIEDVPVFTSEPVIAVNHNAAYIYKLAASDGDGDLVNYGVEALPEWLSFEEASQTLSGMPSKEQVGSYEVSVWATDGDDTTRQQYTIEVIDLNYPPAFTSAPITSVEEIATYSYELTAEDLDGDLLAFNAVSLPQWLTLDTETAILTGIPQNKDVGNHNVVVSVTDGVNTPVNQTFTLIVTDVNQAPVFASNPIIEGQEGTTYIYSVNATDPDADAVTLSAEVLPSWLSFNGSTGLLTGVPKSTDVGAHEVSLIARDPAGAIGRQEFILTVNNLNDVPEFTSTPVIEANIDAGYVYAVTAFDEDSDTLVFTMNEMPNWMTFQQEGIDYGILSGVPLEGDFGDHLVSITVTDGKSAAVRQLFFIKVGAPLAIINEQLSREVVVYPNPIRNHRFTLKLPKSVRGEVKTSLIDITGRELYSWAFQASDEQLFQLPDLAPGQYHLLIQTEQGLAMKPLLIK